MINSRIWQPIFHIQYCSTFRLGTRGKRNSCNRLYATMGGVVRSSVLRRCLTSSLSRPSERRKDPLTEELVVDNWASTASRQMGKIRPTHRSQRRRSRQPFAPTTVRFPRDDCWRAQYRMKTCAVSRRPKLTAFKQIKTAGLKRGQTCANGLACFRR